MAEGDFELVITHGAGTLTMTQASNNKVLSRSWEWNENKPKTVTLKLDNEQVAARNLLSSSCALWTSGTGAMDIGDYLDLYLYTTAAPTTRKKVFHGTIASIVPHDDFTVDVVAVDRLAAYQGIGKSIVKTYFANYLDREVRPNDLDAVGRNRITGVNYANMLMPMSAVEFAASDAVFMTGSSRSGNDPSFQFNTEEFAQAFIAQQSGLVGLEFFYNPGIYYNINMRIGIQADSSGAPDGNFLWYVDQTLANGSNNNWYADMFDFREANLAPLSLNVGQKYWIVIHYLSSSGGGAGNLIGTDDGGNYSAFNFYLRRPIGGGAWSTVSNKNIFLKLYTVEYSTIDPGHYVYDASAQTITLTSLDSVFDQKVMAIPPRRGRISGYYGLKNIKDVLTSILALGPVAASSVGADSTRQINLYRTKGNYLNECLEELVDIRETSGNWSGSQKTLIHGNDAGADCIYVYRRKNLADASSRTFSYAPDTATKDEQRIISFTPSKVIKGRPCSITVTGQSDSGEPVIVTVSDKNTSGGGYSAKSGILLEDSITDNGLKTFLDCAAAGYAKLDSISRDQWEGVLVVDGVFPDMVDLSNVSSTYGSGQIITLNYSPYGISNQKFKVKGVRVGNSDDGFVTELTISNLGPLINNPFSDVSARALLSESFQSPTDGQANSYIVASSPNVVTLPSPVWMELQTSYGSGIWETTRPVCQITTNDNYNQKVVHAEFPASSGYCQDGSPVGCLTLYNAAVGGAAVDHIDLSAAQALYKWKSGRVVVDYVMPIA